MADRNYIIQGKSIKAIADAVRAKRNVQLSPVGAMTPAEIAAEVHKIRLGCPIAVSMHTNGNGEWERPEEWPDLDLLTRHDNEVFMTIDNSGRIDDAHLSVSVTTVDTSGVTYEVGGIVDGAFVAEETTTVASGTVYTRVFEQGDAAYPVVRIAATANIIDFGFNGLTVDGHKYDERYNAVVERVGKIYTCNGIWGTYWIERDSTIIGYLTSMQYTWYSCYSLQSLDLSGWDTSGWAVTNMGSTWYYCYSLQSLDLSGWATSGWAVTSMQYTWYSCYSLQSLDLSGWDTSGWAVTNMGSTWYNCYSLQSLDLSGWATSGWAVTNMGSTWYYCYSLQSLDLSGWDTSGWAVTNMGSTWYCCYSLQSLDLSGWDTSGWAVTSMQYTWNSCYSLQSLDLSGWDTSGWAVTNMGSTWYCCYSLQSLDLSGWATSGWAVTSMQYTWYCCYSLQSLDLSGWATSGWAVTDWSRVFYMTRSLKSIDLSMFDLSKITQWGSSSYSNAMANFMVNFTAGATNSGKFKPTAYKTLNLTLCNLMSRQSLLNVIDMLASGVSGYTLKIGTINLNKLTAEEKALATAKGWSIIA